MQKEAAKKLYMGKLMPYGLGHVPFIGWFMKFMINGTAFCCCCCSFVDTLLFAYEFAELQLQL